jgi:hypothetical protein
MASRSMMSRGVLTRYNLALDNLIKCPINARNYTQQSIHLSSRPWILDPWSVEMEIPVVLITTIVVRKKISLY